MATVYGKTINPGFKAMWPYSIQLEFELDYIATTTDGLTVSTQKQYVTPETDGNWVLNLVSTDSMTQDRYYRMTERWLNGDGMPLGIDLPIWKFKIPEGVQAFTDLVPESANNPMVLFVQDTQPTSWSVGSVWINTITGDIYRKQA